MKGEEGMIERMRRGREERVRSRKESVERRQSWGGGRVTDEGSYSQAALLLTQALRAASPGVGGFMELGDR